MTYLSSAGGAMSSSSSHPALQHPLGGQTFLTVQIGLRRARLAALEAEMTAACEAAALGARYRTNAAIERACGNRATWHRYLAAAMRLEPDYGPRMRRLRQEIGQLERLKTLLNAA